MHKRLKLKMINFQKVYESRRKDNQELRLRTTDLNHGSATYGPPGISSGPQSHKIHPPPSFFWKSETISNYDEHFFVFTIKSAETSEPHFKVYDSPLGPWWV